MLRLHHRQGDSSRTRISKSSGAFPTPPPAPPGDVGGVEAVPPTHLTKERFLSSGGGSSPPSGADRVISIIPFPQSLDSGVPTPTVGFDIGLGATLQPPRGDPVPPTIIALPTPGVFASIGPAPSSSQTGTAALSYITYSINESGNTVGGASHTSSPTGRSGNPGGSGGPGGRHDPGTPNSGGSPGTTEEPEGHSPTPQGSLGTGPKVAIAFSAVFLFSIVVFFILRRFYRLKRSDRMRRWWSTNAGRFRGHAVSIGEKSPRASSVGSSFGTATDRGFDFIPTTPPPQLPTPPTAHPLRDDFHDVAAEIAAVDEAPLTLASPVSAESGASTWALSLSAAYDFPQPPPDAHVSARRPSHPNSPKSGPFILQTSHNPTDNAHIPVATTDSPALQGGVQLGAVMTIRRSFLPSRHDEMSVSLKDSVRIVGLYDDGWLAVEPVNAGNDIVERPRRFIPVDCLREPGDGSSVSRVAN